MNVTIHEKAESDKIATLVVESEVDAYTAPRLRERLIPLCEKAEVVNLDLSKVTYMDSTGLGVLIGAYKALRTSSGRLKIYGINPRLERLFQITGLSEIFCLEDKSQGDGKS